MLKYEMDEKAVRQQVTERGKREKKRKFLPPELNNLAYKVVKSDEERKKERRELPPQDLKYDTAKSRERKGKKGKRD